MNITERIQSFSDYLEKKLESIDNLETDDSQQFKQTLYVSFIDSLSSCIYPDDRNKDQFVKFVNNYTDWAYRDTYCWFHLHLYFKKNPISQLRTLSDYVNDEYSKWDNIAKDKSIVVLDKLPNRGDLESKLPKGATPESKFDVTPLDKKKRFCLNEFKFSYLLYRLRNKLVHDFSSGCTEKFNMQISEPFYQAFNLNSPFSGAEVHYELVFPTAMLKALCNSALTKVVGHYKQRQLNPFPDYYSSSYWLNNL